MLVYPRILLLCVSNISKILVKVLFLSCGGCTDVWLQYVPTPFSPLLPCRGFFRCLNHCSFFRPERFQISSSEINYII